MVNGRNGDTYDRGPREPRTVPNEESLLALGEQIDRGLDDGPVANEAGLLALGEQIDRAHDMGSSGPEPGTGGGRPPGGPPGGRPPGGNGPSRPTGRRDNGKPRWSTRRKVLTALAAVLVLVVGVGAAGYGYVRYEWDKVHTLHCSTCQDAADGKPYNVLLIGSDSRAGNKGKEAQEFGTENQVGGQRSDTIKIIHVIPATGTARMLSIPRDTYVTMSGLAQSTGLTGAQKINTAFNNGPNALIETIQNTFGIPISHFVVINFNAVINSVNALGGITLDFKYPVRDYNTGTGETESGLDITQTGCQLLHGSQVLALSRSRYYQYYDPSQGGWTSDPLSDLGRIQRQNIIIEAMLAKAKSTYNPVTLNSFITSFVKDLEVDTNMSLGLVYDLAERYHAFSPSSLQTWTLPTVNAVTSYGSDVELADTEVPSSYVDTIAQFLGGPADAVTTPPLDQYGDPISVPTTTTTTVPRATTIPKHGKAASHAATTPPSETTTTLPDYDPSLC